MTADVTPRKYIFCVSPGRSGSHYLSHVLAGVGDICAVHEPEHQFPAYSALRPHLWDLKNRLFLDSFTERRHLKLAQISDLMSRSPSVTYAETNPLFSTLWHDVIFDGFSGQDVIVIILRRSAVKVLKSLLDLGWFHSRDGNDWMVTSYSVNSLTQSLGPENQATAFHLVISHILNVEMHAIRIKARCLELGHKVIELRSDQLFGDQEAVHTMLTQCGLGVDLSLLHDVKSSIRNKLATRNKQFDFPLETCAKELDVYLRRCSSSGISVPESLYI